MANDEGESKPGSSKSYFFLRHSRGVLAEEFRLCLQTSRDLFQMPFVAQSLFRIGRS